MVSMYAMRSVQWMHARLRRTTRAGSSLPLTKITAAITAGCFLFSAVVATPIQAVVEHQQAANEFAALIDRFVLPSSVGRISEMQDLGSEKVVVTIQDLHCHAEVQRNIARILALLDHNYHIGSVNVEGAVGVVDTSWLTGIENEKLKNALVDSLVDQGQLTGSELFTVLKNRPQALKGMEDESLYRKNFGRLNYILGKQQDYEQHIALLQRAVQEYQQQYFGVPNRHFEDVCGRYRNGTIASGKFYRLLMKYVEKLNRTSAAVNPAEAIDLQQYPNLSAYIALEKQGKKLDYRRTARQLQAFMHVLKQKLPYAAYTALVEKTDNFTRLDALYFHIGDIIKEYRLDIRAAFPDLQAFLAYNDCAAGINPLELVREERLLINEIRTGLSEDVNEREISFLTDFSHYYADFLRNKLSAADYAYFKQHHQEFILLWGKYGDGQFMSGVQDEIELLTAFYDTNVNRNTAFIHHLLGDYATAGKTATTTATPADATRMLRNAKELIVAVTGGFHSEGMEKILAERGVSYITITPDITQDAGKASQVYTKLAQQQARILSQAYALEQLSTFVNDLRNNRPGDTKKLAIVLKALFVAIEDKQLAPELRTITDLIFPTMQVHARKQHDGSWAILVKDKETDWKVELECREDQVILKTQEQVPNEINDPDAIRDTRALTRRSNYANGENFFRHTPAGKIIFAALQWLNQKITGKTAFAYGRATELFYTPFIALSDLPLHVIDIIMEIAARRSITREDVCRLSGAAGIAGVTAGIFLLSLHAPLLVLVCSGYFAYGTTHMLYNQWFGSTTQAHAALTVHEQGHNDTRRESRGSLIEQPDNYDEILIQELSAKIGGEQKQLHVDDIAVVSIMDMVTVNNLNEIIGNNKLIKLVLTAPENMQEKASYYKKIKEEYFLNIAKYLIGTYAFLQNGDQYIKSVPFARYGIVEMLKNALVHGNQADLMKPIYVYVDEIGQKVAVIDTNQPLLTEQFKDQFAEEKYMAKRNGIEKHFNPMVENLNYAKDAGLFGKGVGEKSIKRRNQYIFRREMGKSSPSGNPESSFTYTWFGINPEYRGFSVVDPKYPSYKLTRNDNEVVIYRDDIGIVYFSPEKGLRLIRSLKSLNKSIAMRIMDLAASTESNLTKTRKILDDFAAFADNTQFGRTLTRQSNYANGEYFFRHTPAGKTIFMVLQWLNQKITGHPALVYDRATELFYTPFIKISDMPLHVFDIIMSIAVRRSITREDLFRLSGAAGITGVTAGIFLLVAHAPFLVLTSSVYLAYGTTHMLYNLWFGSGTGREAPLTMGGEEEKAIRSSVGDTDADDCVQYDRDLIAQLSGRMNNEEFSSVRDTDRMVTVCLKDIMSTDTATANLNRIIGREKLIKILLKPQHDTADKVALYKKIGVECIPRIAQYLVDTYPFFRTGEMDSKTLPRIRTALVEIMNNAFVHGNQADLTKPIYLYVDENNQRLAVIDTNQLPVLQQYNRQMLRADIVAKIHVKKSFKSALENITAARKAKLNGAKVGEQIAKNMQGFLYHRESGQNSEGGKLSAKYTYTWFGVDPQYQAHGIDLPRLAGTNSTMPDISIATPAKSDLSKRAVMEDELTIDSRAERLRGINRFLWNNIPVNLRENRSNICQYASNWSYDLVWVPISVSIVPVDHLLEKQGMLWQARISDLYESKPVLFIDSLLNQPGNRDDQRAVIIHALNEIRKWEYFRQLTMDSTVEEMQSLINKQNDDQLILFAVYNVRSVVQNLPLYESAKVAETYQEIVKKYHIDESMECLALRAIYFDEGYGDGDDIGTSLAMTLAWTNDKYLAAHRRARQLYVKNYFGITRALVAAWISVAPGPLGAPQAELARITAIIAAKMTGDPQYEALFDQFIDDHMPSRMLPELWRESLARRNLVAGLTAIEKIAISMSLSLGLDAAHVIDNPKITRAIVRAHRNYNIATLARKILARLNPFQGIEKAASYMTMSVEGERIDYKDLTMRTLLLEDRLHSSEPYEMSIIIRTLGEIYSTFIRQGVSPKVNKLISLVLTESQAANKSLEKALIKICLEFLDCGMQKQYTVTMDSMLKSMYITEQALGIKVLEGVYKAQLKRGKLIDLSIIHKMLRHPEGYVRRTAVDALAELYIIMIPSQDVDLSLFERGLDDPNPEVMHAAFKALSRISAKIPRNHKGQDTCVFKNILKNKSLYYDGTSIALLGNILSFLLQSGESIDVAYLEKIINDMDVHVQIVAIEQLGKVYEDLIKHGMLIDDAFLKTRLHNNYKPIQRASVLALGEMYAANVMATKKPIDIALLINALQDSDQFMRKTAVEAIGKVLIECCHLDMQVDISPVANALTDEKETVRIAAIQTLALVYSEMIKNGKTINLNMIAEELENDSAYIKKEAIIALGGVYAELVRQNQKADLSLIHVFLDSSDPLLRANAVKAISVVYVEQLRSGKTVDINMLEKMLQDVDATVREMTIESLGYIYSEQIKQKKLVDLTKIECMLVDKNGWIHKKLIDTLDMLYTIQQENNVKIAWHGLNSVTEKNIAKISAVTKTEIRHSGKQVVLNKYFNKYMLWHDALLPFSIMLTNDYLENKHYQRYIEHVQRICKEKIENGFDLNDKESRMYVFAGLRAIGIQCRFHDYVQRLNRLYEFDLKYPGYLKSLFTKTKGLKPFSISKNGISLIDMSVVDTVLIDKTVSEFMDWKNGIDSFGWANSSEYLSLKNVHNYFKINQGANNSDEAQENEKELRKFMMQDKRDFYRLLFKIAQKMTKDSNKIIADKGFLLMRDLVISDALLDKDVLDILTSDNTEMRIYTLKRIYDDYNNFLPQLLGSDTKTLRGLKNVMKEVFAEIYAEINKIESTTMMGRDIYTLVPAGFTGVFRGRAGIMTCAFSVDKGAPYARAMHEDTMYYLIYKGKKLRGYISLIKTITPTGEKVLHIYTISSPSFNNKELLSNLFIALYGIAREWGAIGISLPSNELKEYRNTLTSQLQRSFMFGISDTIEHMDVYKNATQIALKPVHYETWENFNNVFGRDEYNSIDMSMDFRLLAMDESEIDTADKYQRNSAERNNTSLISSVFINKHDPSEPPGGISPQVPHVINKKTHDTDDVILEREFLAKSGIPSGITKNDFDNIPVVSFRDLTPPLDEWGALMTMQELRSIIGTHRLFKLFVRPPSYMTDTETYYKDLKDNYFPCIADYILEAYPFFKTGEQYAHEVPFEAYAIVEILKIALAHGNQMDVMEPIYLYVDESGKKLAVIDFNNESVVSQFMQQPEATNSHHELGVRVKNIATAKKVGLFGAKLGEKTIQERRDKFIYCREGGKNTFTGNPSSRFTYTWFGIRRPEADNTMEQEQYCSNRVITQQSNAVEMTGGDLGERHAEARNAAESNLGGENRVLEDAWMSIAYKTMNALLTSGHMVPALYSTATNLPRILANLFTMRKTDKDNIPAAAAQRLPRTIAVLALSLAFAGAADVFKNAGRYARLARRAPELRNKAVYWVQEYISDTMYTGSGMLASSGVNSTIICRLEGASEGLLKLHNRIMVDGQQITAYAGAATNENGDHVPVVYLDIPAGISFADGAAALMAELADSRRNGRLVNSVQKRLGSFKALRSSLIGFQPVVILADPTMTNQLAQSRLLKEHPAVFGSAALIAVGQVSQGSLEKADALIDAQILENSDELLNQIAAAARKKKSERTARGKYVVLSLEIGRLLERQEWKSLAAIMKTVEGQNIRLRGWAQQIKNSEQLVDARKQVAALRNAGVLVHGDYVVSPDQTHRERQTQEILRLLQEVGLAGIELNLTTVDWRDDEIVSWVQEIGTAVPDAVVTVVLPPNSTPAGVITALARTHKNILVIQDREIRGLHNATLSSYGAGIRLVSADQGSTRPLKQCLDSVDAPLVELSLIDAARMGNDRFPGRLDLHQILRWKGIGRSIPNMIRENIAALTAILEETPDMVYESTLRYDDQDIPDLQQWQADMRKLFTDPRFAEIRAAIIAGQVLPSADDGFVNELDGLHLPGAAGLTMGQLVARYRASTDLAARQKVGAMLVLVVKGISERILMDAAFEKGKDQGLADPVQRRLFGQLLLQQDLMNMMPRGPLTYLDELNSGRSMQGLPLRAAAERVMQEGRYDENVSPADIGAVLDVIMETPDTDKNGYINSAVRHLQKRMNTAAQPQEKEHAIRELLRILYLYGDRTYISTLQKQQQMQQQLTKAILSAA